MAASTVSSEQALKAILAMDSELSSLACTISEDSGSDEKPCERDFSDQEVGISCNMVTRKPFSTQHVSKTRCF